MTMHYKACEDRVVSSIMLMVALQVPDFDGLHINGDYLKLVQYTAIMRNQHTTSVTGKAGMCESGSATYNIISYSKLQMAAGCSHNSDGMDIIKLQLLTRRQRQCSR